MDILFKIFFGVASGLGFLGIIVGAMLMSADRGSNPRKASPWFMYGGAVLFVAGIAGIVFQQ